MGQKRGGYKHTKSSSRQDVPKAQLWVCRYFFGGGVTVDPTVSTNRGGAHKMTSVSRLLWIPPGLWIDPRALIPFQLLSCETQKSTNRHVQVYTWVHERGGCL